MADTPLPGYPAHVSGKLLEIVQHTGPASYQTGGESFDCQHLFGFGVIDRVDAGYTFNAAAAGTYKIVVLYPIGQAISGASGSTTVTLQWFVVASGLEVQAGVNLSAEFARLLVIGG